MDKKFIAKIKSINIIMYEKKFKFFVFSEDNMLRDKFHIVLKITTFSIHILILLNYTIFFVNIKDILFEIKENLNEYYIADISDLGKGQENLI